jgi:hypothetical protein
VASVAHAHGVLQAPCVHGHTHCRLRGTHTHTHTRARARVRRRCKCHPPWQPAAGHCRRLTTTLSVRCCQTTRPPHLTASSQSQRCVVAVSKHRRCSPCTHALHLAQPAGRHCLVAAAVPDCLSHHRARTRAQTAFYDNTKANKFVRAGFSPAVVNLALAYHSTTRGDETQVGSLWAARNTHRTCARTHAPVTHHRSCRGCCCGCLRRRSCCFVKT